MFHVHGVSGHVFTGTLEALRQHPAVSAIARVRRIAGIDKDADPLTNPAHASAEAEHRMGREAQEAYGQATRTRERQPLRSAADVMRSPAITLPAAATVGGAWRALAQHGIGQAPVVDSAGALIGLVARAELMPAASLDALSAGTDAPRLAQPVTAVMWSPVPSTSADTDLRRVAALLLDTGLPGVPVADRSGAVIGFVSRTDLLRALATDPPLDLWS